MISDKVKFLTIFILCYLLRTISSYTWNSDGGRNSHDNSSSNKNGDSVSLTRQTLLITNLFTFLKSDKSKTLISGPLQIYSIFSFAYQAILSEIITAVRWLKSHIFKNTLNQSFWNLILHLYPNATSKLPTAFNKLQSSNPFKKYIYCSWILNHPWPSIY